MERDNIIKALECCHLHSHKNCPECPYNKDTEKACFMLLMEHSLALITSQEQRIAELEIELKAMRGAANAYKMHIVELTEENERLSNRIVAKIVIDDEKLEEIKNECLQRFKLDIRAVRADTVEKIQDMFAVRFGTYTDKDMTPIREVFWLLDKFAKEMLEKTNENNG